MKQFKRFEVQSIQLFNFENKKVTLMFTFKSNKCLKKTGTRIFKQTPKIK